jgi:hypothetical protein
MENPQHVLKSALSELKVSVQELDLVRNNIVEHGEELDSIKNNLQNTIFSLQGILEKSK